MPSIIQTTTGQDYNLLGAFTSDDGSGNEYTYSVPASSVKMWIDFSETPVDRSNYSSGISAISYVKTGGSLNDPVQGTADFGGVKEFNTIRTRLNTPNAGHTRVDFTSTTNALTFGDGANDSSFSVSFWYNRESAYSENAEEHLIQKGDGSSREIDIRWHPNPDGSTNGAFNIRLYDGANSIFCQAFSYNEDFFEDTWSHIVVTYDGSSSHSGVNFYINGNLQTFTYTATSGYTAMSGVSDKLYIGATTSAISTDGTFSELAFFSEELSQNTIRAIYYATKDGATITNNNYYSGEVSNPVKDIIKTLDKKIRYIDDCGTKKGTYSSNFNDDNTIDFVERELIGSIGVEENTTSTPFIAANSYSNYGISLSSTYGSSFATSQTRNTFEGDIDPFNEHNKFFLNPDFSQIEKTSIDIFEQIGLEENTNRKDIIEIDVTASESTTFGVEQGVGSGAENDLMVYWNNSLKRWEKIGGTILSPTTTGGIQSMLTDGKIGFAPTEGMVIPSDIKNFKAAFKNYGLPVENFGFPKHPKYHATGSQYLEMKDFICEPFVVEKVVCEFDVKLYVDSETAKVFHEDSTPTNYSETGHLGSYFTFFLLNQRENDTQNKIQGSTFSSQDDTSESDLFRRISNIDEAFDETTSSRDLITYLQAVVYSDSNTVLGEQLGQFESGDGGSVLSEHKGFLKEGYERAVNISGSNFVDSSSGFDSNAFSFDGKIVLSGTVIEEKKHQSMGINFNIGGTQYAITDLGNNRSSLGVIDHIKPKSFRNNLIFDDSVADNSYKFSLYPSLSKSAYEGITYKTTKFNNFERPNPYILFPEDKLIFGWQTPVTFNASALDSSNASSQMTIKSGTGRIKLYGSFLRNKKALHKESLFYSNNMVSKTIRSCNCDQFQIATRNQQEGTYNSVYLSGVIPNRSAVSKTGAGETINSSIHFSSHKDSKEIIYDTYLPDMVNFLKRSGVGAAIYGTEIKGASAINVFLQHRVNEDLYRLEEKRQKSSKIRFSDATIAETKRILFSKGYPEITDEDLTDNVKGSTSLSYGMYNYNLTKNKAQFNTRHFGHFADMIEQRKIYTFEEKGRVTYPVVKMFVRDNQRIEPIESSAQNISMYSTSSFPFIDGEPPTSRTDDVTKIDNITIFPDLPSTDIFNR
jgi:hypothetical protein